MTLQALTAWPVVYLADVLTSIENGSRPSGGVDQFHTGVPSLGGEHLDNDGGFNFTNIKYVPTDYFERMSKGIVQAEDILIVKDGATTGKVSFVRGDFPYSTAAINEHVFILRTDTSLIWPEFAFFFLYSSWGQVQIRRSYQGAAIGGINQDFVNRVQIPIPSIPEQQRIAAILRHAANLRHERGEVDKLAQKLIPALFYDMFGDPMTNPMKWEIVRFRQLGQTRLGKMLDQKKQRGGNRRPYLRNVNVQWGYFNLSDVNEMDFSDEELEELRLVKGDILICEGGEVGRAAIWNDELPEVYFQKALHRTRLRKTEATPEYIVTLLSIFAKRGGFREITSQATIAHLTGEKLHSLRLPLPSVELQQEFSQYYNLFKEIEILQKKDGAEVDDLFQSLLARSLTGELTKIWRGQNEVELRTATEERDKWLQERNLRRSTSFPIIVEQPATIDNVLLARLSSTQQYVYSLIQNHPNPYFTLQTLWEGQEEDTSLDRDVIERGLSVLEALGVILKVSIPVSPTGEAFYQNVYRLAASQPIEEELRALKDRFPNIRL